MAERGRKSSEIYRLTPGRSSFHTTWPLGRQPWALQHFLAEIADHCPFRLSNGDRDAGDDLRGCRRPSLSGIGTRDPQVGRGTVRRATAVRAGARWLWARLAPDTLA